MGIERVLPKWIDRDEHRSVLMEGIFVIGEVRSTIGGWSALLGGESVARGLKSNVTAKIAVANARARALLPIRKIATDQDHRDVIRRLSRHEQRV